MKKIIILPLLLLVLSVSAKPIGEKRAREIATNFFAASKTRTATVVLELEWAGSDVDVTDGEIGQTRSAGSSTEDGAGDELIYIYNRVDARGFVVVAGDDGVERAIIAFSHSNNFDVENMPDGAKEILQAWCKQIEAARSSRQSKVSSTRATTDVGNEVCKYETALWGQDAPYNNQAPIYSGKATKAGCVATAMAILCFYHKWPEKGVGVTPEYTYEDGIGESRTIPANELGRIYDYSSMLSSYSDGYTESQGVAVANLMYDLGTSVKMKYEQGGSGASSKTATKSMIQYFGYTKDAIHVNHEGYSEEEWTALLKKNIKEYGPTRFSGKSDSGAHEFILDGYTDTDYFSINYGWDGSRNGYYLLPNISYYKGQAAALYLVPDKDGTSEYRDYVTLQAFTSTTSGNVYRGIYTTADSYSVSTNFKCYIAAVSSGWVEFYGKICVAHCDKLGEIKRIIWTWSRESSPLTTSALGSSKSIYIKDAIEEGDRLQVFYKGVDSDKWIRALSGEAGAYDEVLLCASPKEVAESLNLEYDKELKTFTYDSIHAIHYSVADESGTILMEAKSASHTANTIDASSLKPGAYTFSFASGGEPYKIKIVL